MSAVERDPGLRLRVRAGDVEVPGRQALPGDPCRVTGGRWAGAAGYVHEVEPTGHVQVRTGDRAAWEAWEEGGRG